MKLVKFRVTNYKSIIDSGYCFPTDTITLLAGKNEAGKSSILEALVDFNLDKDIRQKAISLTNSNNKPKIEIIFNLNEKDHNSIIQASVLQDSEFFEVQRKLKEIDTLQITKEFPNNFSLPPCVDLLIREWALSQEKNIRQEFIIELSTHAPTNENIPKNIAPQISQIVKSAPTIRHGLSGAQSELDKLLQNHSPEILQAFKAIASKYQSSADTLHAREAALKGELKKAVLAQIPNFILFSSFEDIFPNEIPFDELSSNSWVQDIGKISDLDIELIKGTNSAGKKQHKHKLNIQLNDDFKQYWTQDFSNLSIDWDGNLLSFWIQENGIYYPPELRSQGRRWHLAFYVKVSARIKDSSANIILIDEPGLYLHAVAQRDILKHLENSCKSNQILLSTHSPYLIEPEKLDRVRLVIKSETSGTTIENKIHAIADKETLTPILTAIGLELNQGIANNHLSSNVIVEGPSDYFYLTGLSQILKIEDMKFVSGGGAGNMTKVGTIIQGWGAKVLYLFDNDKAYQNAKISIKKEWLTISKDWLTSLNLQGSIEDIFSKEEFAAIVGVDKAQITTANSEYMKINKIDKVLPAKLFLDRLRSGKQTALSAPTLERVKTLLDDLKLKFENYYDK